MSLVTHRAVSSFLHCAAALSALTLAGCATVQDSLYFKAVARGADGKEVVNYYRVDIKASGAMAGNYKIRSGYISADTIDTLNGEIPIIPAADLSREEYKAFAATKKNFTDRLIQESGKTDGVSLNSNDELDDFTKHAARIGWFASLNDHDFISIGQKEDVNPYVFRKLVFYATAKDLNLSEYDKQVDQAIEKTGAMANHARDQREAQKKEKQEEHEAKTKAAEALAPGLFSGSLNLDDEATRALMGLLLDTPIPTDK